MMHLREKNKVKEKLSFGDKISEVKIDANPMPRKRIIFYSLSFN